jgi:hypothetical protein
MQRKHHLSPLPFHLTNVSIDRMNGSHAEILPTRSLGLACQWNGSNMAAKTDQTTARRVTEET